MLILKFTYMAIQIMCIIAAITVFVCYGIKRYKTRRYFQYDRFENVVSAELRLKYILEIDGVAIEENEDLRTLDLYMTYNQYVKDMHEAAYRNNNITDHGFNFGIDKFNGVPADQPVLIARIPACMIVKDKFVYYRDRQYLDMYKMSNQLFNTSYPFNSGGSGGGYGQTIYIHTNDKQNGEKEPREPIEYYGYTAFTNVDICAYKNTVANSNTTNALFMVMDESSMPRCFTKYSVNRDQVIEEIPYFIFNKYIFMRADFLLGTGIIRDIAESKKSSTYEFLNGKLTCRKG